jgi:two-component system phosphate regulon sensor histidine kinase PhoR
MSFRLKLIFAFLLVLTVCLAVSWTWISRQVEGHIYRVAEADLDTRLQMILPLIRVDAPDLDAFVDRLTAGTQSRVTVMLPDGRVVADSALSGRALAEVENHASRPEMVQALQTGRGFSRRYSTSVGQHLLYVARRLPDGSAVVRIAENPEVIRGFSAGLLRGIAAVTLLLALAGGVAVWFISRHLTVSLERLSEAAQTIAGGNFEAEIPVRSGDEFGDLARRLEALARRLQDQIRLLASERNHLSAVLDSLTEGVLVTDAQGRITGANPAFLQMFPAGSAPLGRAPLEVVRSVEISEGVRRILEGGERWEAEIHSGERVFLARFAPIGTVGRPMGTAVVFLDVTELRRLQQAQRDFISNVSHELKTPLTSIQGYAETLLQEELPAVHARFVEKICRNAAQLTEMIGELFSLARLESGGGELRIEPVDFATLLERLRHEYSEQLEQRSLSFEIDCPHPADFPADRRYIERVFRNLIENALKYTDQGGIKVRMERLEGEFRFSVSDTGIGIPQEHLPRIFQRFYRVDRDRSRRTGGTGIGLAIVKHVVQLHNGRVWAESRIGVGTTVYFTLPAGTPSSGEPLTPTG